MDATLAQALGTLRRKIRKAAQEYRHSTDNSRSLFHPEQGYVYAYDRVQVELALDEFEKTLAENRKTPDELREFAYAALKVF